MGLQEEIKALNDALDVLEIRREEHEFLGDNDKADALTDIIEGIIKHMAELSAEEARQS